MFGDTEIEKVNYPTKIPFLQMMYILIRYFYLKRFLQKSKIVNISLVT